MFAALIFTCISFSTTLWPHVDDRMLFYNRIKSIALKSWCSSYSNCLLYRKECFYEKLPSWSWVRMQVADQRPHRVSCAVVGRKGPKIEFKAKCKLCTETLPWSKNAGSRPTLEKNLQTTKLLFGFWEFAMQGGLPCYMFLVIFFVRFYNCLCTTPNKTNIQSTPAFQQFFLTNSL